MNIQAAGFDCSKASTVVEKMICASEKISNLDSKMSKLYRQALNKNIRDKTILIEMQMSWLTKKRNTCTSTDCLENQYLLQIEELECFLQGCIKPFNNISSFDKKSLDNILADDILDFRIKMLIGGWYELFNSNLVVSSGAELRKDRSLVIEGLRPHMGTMEDAIMEIEPDGHIHIAINTVNSDSILFLTSEQKETDGPVILYFTNDSTRFKQPDSTISSFITWINDKNYEKPPLVPMLEY